MKFTNRLLAAVLAATMLISSVPVSAFANEFNDNEDVNIETVAETDEMGEIVSVSVGEEDASEETETDSEASLETIADEDIISSTEDLAISADNIQNVEKFYYVDDDYASEYSIDDLKRELEGAALDVGMYSDDEISLSAVQIFSDEKSAALYIKNNLRDRASIITFSTTQKYDVKQLIELACSEELANNTREGGYIRANYKGMSASISDVISKSTYSYTYAYTICPVYASTASQEKEVDTKVATIVSSLGLRNSGKSQVDKVKAINDYLVDNIIYGNDGTFSCHGSYAALIKGKSVCQGYCASFYRLCKEAGIDCRYVVGSRIGHAWNMVCISELENKPVWYNMDVTWNDSDADNQGRWRYDYFLKNDIDFIGHPRDDEYLTDSFNSKHPMAEKSYEAAARLLDKDNLDYTFRDFAGKLYSSAVDTDTKRPKLLVFYGAKDQKSQESMELISRSKAATSNCVDIYAIEIRGAAQTDINQFEKNYAKNGTIKFVTSVDAKNFDIANQYLKYIERRNVVSSTPVVVMIDDSNVIRIVSEGYITNYDIDKMCMEELRGEWNSEAPSLESISLNRTEIKLGRSKTITECARLTVNYNPVDCIDPKYTSFESSNEAVASVDSSGLVRAVGKGEAIITATCSRHTAEAKITVVEYAEGISIADSSGTVLDDGTYNILAGDEKMFNLVTKPDKSVVRGKVQWRISNSELVNITQSDDGYSVVASAACDIKAPQRVTLHAEADGFNAKCDLLIEPSMLKLNANGGTIDGKTYKYFRVSQGKPIGELPIPDTRKGYSFQGWSTTVGIRDDEYVSANTIFEEQWELLAVWKPAEPEKMWIRDIGSYEYTGKLIKPVVRVYDGDILLKEGVDYTVAYRNNLKAYTYSKEDVRFEATKAPCVIISGKNNYDSKQTIYFTITQKNINDKDVITNLDTINKTENGRQLLSVPEIKWGNTLLKNKTDFTLEYPDCDKAGAYIQPGTYRITVVGTGNYTGSKTVEMQIYSKNRISITKATVKNLRNYEYNGAAITQSKDFALVYGGKTLVEGKDYTATYSNNKEVGLAQIYITGRGDYSGSRKLSYRITGNDITKAKAVVGESGVASVVYTGQAIEPPVLVIYTVNRNTITLKKSTDNGQTGDYTVSYSDNIKAGTGKVTIKGINGYSGTLVKTFRIISYNVTSLGETRFSVICPDSAEYCKSGARVPVTVSFESKKSSGAREWITLTEGIDYTLKYTNNTKTYSLGQSDDGFYNKSGKTMSPAVQIVFRGNYAGKITRYYKVFPGSLKTQARIVAPDVFYSAKAGKCFSKITVLDNAGKRIAAGSDYNSNVEYRYADKAYMTDGSIREKGTLVSKGDSPKAGTVINVIITGLGNYSSAEADKLCTTIPYKIIESNKNIASGIAFTVKDKYYSGSGMNPDTGIVITKEDITFKADKNHADFTANDFEIVEGSYSKNKLTGIAAVTLRGLNSYGGTKEVKFRIRKKSIF